MHVLLVWTTRSPAQRCRLAWCPSSTEDLFCQEGAISLHSISCPRGLWPVHLHPRTLLGDTGGSAGAVVLFPGDVSLPEIWVSACTRLFLQAHCQQKSRDQFSEASRETRGTSKGDATGNNCSRSSAGIAMNTKPTRTRPTPVVSLYIPVCELAAFLLHLQGMFLFFPVLSSPRHWGKKESYGTINKQQLQLHLSNANMWKSIACFKGSLLSIFPLTSCT